MPEALGFQGGNCRPYQRGYQNLVGMHMYCHPESLCQAGVGRPTKLDHNSVLKAAEAQTQWLRRGIAGSTLQRKLLITGIEALLKSVRSIPYFPICSTGIVLVITTHKIRERHDRPLPNFARSLRPCFPFPVPVCFPWQAFDPPEEAA